MDLTKLSDLFTLLLFLGGIGFCSLFLVRSQSSLQVLIRPHDTPCGNDLIIMTKMVLKTFKVLT